MTTPAQKSVTLPREMVAKYSPSNGKAIIQDSPHSLYFRSGPEVSNQIREFLMSRGWYDLSYAQLHPVDHPTLLLPDLLETISSSLRRFNPTQRTILLKALQSQMNKELREFLISKADPVTGVKPALTNKHAVTTPRTQLYYRSVPAIWNLWWEDQGFNPTNTATVSAQVFWNHIFTLSHVFRKDGLQKEMMFYNKHFGGCFSGVIPRGWVLSTEAQQWNIYLVELIKSNNGVNVVVIDPDDILNDDNDDEFEEKVAGDVGGTYEGQCDGKSTKNDEKKARKSAKNDAVPIDPNKPTVYISFSFDNMVQCTAYDPRIPQPNSVDTIPDLKNNQQIATIQKNENIQNTETDLAEDSPSNLPQINNTLPSHVVDNHVWIAKPSGGARGEGIFVFNNLNKLNERIKIITKKKLDLTVSPTQAPPIAILHKDKVDNVDGDNFDKNGLEGGSSSPISTIDIKKPTPPTGKLFVGTLTVQEYINNNMLVGNPKYKFDLRLYVLIVNHFPLEIYIHRMGIVRVASSPYEDDINNTGAHLTNFSVGKKLVGVDKKGGKKGGKKDEKDEQNDNNGGENDNLDEKDGNNNTTPSPSSSMDINTIEADQSHSTLESTTQIVKNNAIRPDRRYDSLKCDEFDAATRFSDGLKWTLDEFRWYITQRKEECDKMGLKMKSFEETWLDIKHLVLKAIIPTIPTQCYGRGGTPGDVLKNFGEKFKEAEKFGVFCDENDETNNSKKVSKDPHSALSSTPHTTVWEHLFNTALNDTNPVFRGYELLGIDVMLHNDGSPILIEMNRSPAMVVQTPADYAKTQVLHDTFNMLKIEQSILAAKRNKFVRENLQKEFKNSTQTNPSENNPPLENTVPKSDPYFLQINGVDVPFNWKNNANAFFLKYQHHNQFVTNTCPYPSESLESYPIDYNNDGNDEDNNHDYYSGQELCQFCLEEKEKEKEKKTEKVTTNCPQNTNPTPPTQSIGTKDHDVSVDTDGKPTMSGSDAKRPALNKKLALRQSLVEKSYQPQKTSTTMSKLMNLTLTHTPGQCECVDKIIHGGGAIGMEKEVLRDFREVVFDSFSSINKNVPDRIRRLIQSSKFKYQQKLQGDDEDVGGSAGNEKDGKNVGGNDDIKGLNGDENNKTGDGNHNGDENDKIGDSVDISNSETAQQQKAQNKQLKQADVIRYPFAQPHGFERIYPLNISNYVSGYSKYRAKIEKFLFNLEEKLSKKIQLFVTAKLSQLNQEEKDIINEYESVQYSLSHVDHLIEYQYMKDLYCSKSKFGGENNDFPNDFFSFIHPIRHIKQSLLYTTGLPELPVLVPVMKSQNSGKNSEQNFETKSKKILQKLLHLIILTTHQNHYWLEKGFSSGLNKTKSIGEAVKDDDDDDDDDDVDTNLANSDLNIHAKMMLNLPKLLDTKLTSPPKAIDLLGVPLIRQKPLDPRIFRAKAKVSQYILVIVRFLMWYHCELVGDKQ
jgi:hypothetical protein